MLAVQISPPVNEGMTVQGFHQGLTPIKFVNIIVDDQKLLFHNRAHNVKIFRTAGWAGAVMHRFLSTDY
jgi:hypothetical protein